MPKVSDTISISFFPVLRNLLEIEAWMTTEKNTPAQLQGNWPSIKRAFDAGLLATALLEDKTIGFFALKKKDRSVTIDVAEIHPDFRGKGIGRKLLNAVAAHLSTEKIYSLDLFCTPSSSEVIWKRLEFVAIPQSENNGLYLVITRCLKPATKIMSDGETLEIWDPESRSGLPYITYNLQFENDSRRLIAPIVLYAEYDWRAKWKVGGKVVKECKLKDLDPVMCDCLILERLPELP